jgi:hypothetical protein
MNELLIKRTAYATVTIPNAATTETDNNREIFMPSTLTGTVAKECEKYYRGTTRRWKDFTARAKILASTSGSEMGSRREMRDDI